MSKILSTAPNINHGCQNNTNVRSDRPAALKTKGFQIMPNPVTLPITANPSSKKRIIVRITRILPIVFPCEPSKNEWSNVNG